jgi:hypothetical protein
MFDDTCKYQIGGKISELKLFVFQNGFGNPYISKISTTYSNKLDQENPFNKAITVERGTTDPRAKFSDV